MAIGARAHDAEKHALGLDPWVEPFSDKFMRKENDARDSAAVGALADLAPLLPARGGLIGLDLGTKTIGVAVSDPDRRLATGIETIARKTFTADAKRILVLAAERKSAGFG